MLHVDSTRILAALTATWMATACSPTGDSGAAADPEVAEGRDGETAAGSACVEGGASGFGVVLITTFLENLLK